MSTVCDYPVGTDSVTLQSIEQEAAEGIRPHFGNDGCLTTQLSIVDGHVGRCSTEEGAHS